MTRWNQWVSMILLALFFAPFIVKLKIVDLSLILLAGLCLPLYDLFHMRGKKQRED
ncbi:MAG: hypothetical protein ACO3C0_10170 [Burkholderiaceae bacterium]